jgi:hypothetical protein
LVGILDLIISKEKDCTTNTIITPDDMNLPIPDDIIDFNILCVKHLFNEQAWQILENEGKLHTEKLLNHFNSSVLTCKNNWSCVSCSVSTTLMNMICCDMCEKWFHWYVQFLNYYAFINYV